MKVSRGQLRSGHLRRDAREIFRSALEQCSPSVLVSSGLRQEGKTLLGPELRVDLVAGSRILLLAYGKASSAMAREVLRILAPRQPTGIAVFPLGAGARLPGLTNFRSSHPLPTHRSFMAGHLLLERVARVGEEDLVVHLISGGASALVAAPLPGLVRMQDKSILHQLLVGSGLGIQEMNWIRKHFSGIKAGRLLLKNPRARHLSLILSDVPPGLTEVVAGGPTLPDPSTWQECLSALRDSGVLSELPARLRDRLRQGNLPETPKPGDPRFRRHRSLVLGSGPDLVAAAAQRASQLGYRVRTLPSSVEDAPEAALDRFLTLWAAAGGHRQEPLCVLGGGEVRVRVDGEGCGGRAQDLAAAAAVALDGKSGCVFLAAGSDGVDGNSPAAGAIANGKTLTRARKAGLDLESLRRSGNTHLLFHALGDTLVTGPTGNNLRDLYLFLGQPVGARHLSDSSKRRPKSEGRE